MLPWSWHAVLRHAVPCRAMPCLLMCCPIQAGDQLYNDGVWQTPTLKAWGADTDQCAAAGLRWAVRAADAMPWTPNTWALHGMLLA